MSNTVWTPEQGWHDGPPVTVELDQAGRLVTTARPARYLATINTPGYMPWDDDPPTFEDADEAWDWLHEMRLQQLEQFDLDADDCAIELLNLAQLEGDALPGVVYGSNPSCDPKHDLGYAYCVTETTEYDDDEDN